MSTKRARRLEKFLRCTLGWETQYENEQRLCSGCVRHCDVSDGDFCPKCGKKLPTGPKYNEIVLEDLENALAYALGETNWLERIRHEP